MKEHHFDKKLKTDLDTYISKVDTDQLWSDIEGRVDALNQDQKRKKRPFIWLWFIIGFLLIGFGLKKFAFIPASHISEQHTNQDMATKPNTSEAVENIEATPQKKVADTKASSITKQADTLHQPKNKSKFTSSEKVKLIKTNDGLEFALPLNDKEAKSGFPVVQQEDSSSKTISSSPLPPKSLFYPLEPLEQIKAFQENNFALLEKELASIQDSIQKQFEAKLQQHLAMSSKVKRPKRQPPFSLALQVHGGISYTHRDLRDKGNEVTEYLQQRKSTEQSLETIHLGIHTDLIHKSGFELSLGGQYSQINEKFNFQGSLIENDTIENGLYGYHINPDGDTTFIYSQIINSRETFHEKTVYNKYKMLEVPLLLSYHWKNESWSIGIQTGIMANIRLKTSGKIFSPSNQILDIEEQQEIIFRSNIGLSYHLGIAGRYNLSENFQFTFSPFFRYFPNSFSQNDYPIRQKYRLAGLRLGLRYQL